MDMWQTIADNGSPLMPEIAKILNMPLQTVVHSVFAEVFTQKGDIADLLNTSLKGFNTSQREQIIKLWKEAPKQAYITREGRLLVEKHYSTHTPLALVSNVDQYGFENFPELDYLKSRFDRFYLSFELGMSKPDLRIFEKMRSDYKTQFSRMLLIGDDEISDQEPATILGINFQLITANRNT